MDDRVKDLLDRVKETAATVGGVAGNTARYAGKCAGEMVDVAKLNMKIFDLKTETHALLQDVGQLVYDAHLGVEVEQNPMDRLLAQLDEKSRAIEALKEQISILKKCRDCPACGAACGKDDKFCKRCGAAL